MSKYNKCQLDIVEEEKSNFVEEEKIDLPEEPITNPFDPSKIDITMRPMTLDLIITRIKEREINLHTEFQRKGDLWDEIKQSRLIESLMIKIPMPAFYFDGTDDNNWLVVDGLQRLTTLNNFVVEKTLSLVQLEFLDQQYHNFKFDALPRQLQRRLGETMVTVFIINPGTPPEVKFNIFKRINTGGLVLEPQEIRHALNQGVPADFLAELAEVPEFKTATCELIKSERMMDREFVLRFLAFTMTHYSQYNDLLDNFLNNAMAMLKNKSFQEREQLKQKFIRAMIFAVEIFGNDAFRKRYSESEKRNPINKALFETWSVVLGNLSEKDLNKLKKRKKALSAKFIDLMSKDKPFDRAITSGTGHPSSVKLRFERIERIVKGVLA